MFQHVWEWVICKRTGSSHPLSPQPCRPPGPRASIHVGDEDIATTAQLQSKATEEVFQKAFEVGTRVLRFCRWLQGMGCSLQPGFSIIGMQQNPTTTYPHCSATHSGLSLQPRWPKGVQGRASLCVACRVGQGHGLPRKSCVFNPVLG